MNETSATLNDCARLLGSAGFPVEDVERWSRSHPEEVLDLASDRRRYGDFWRESAQLLARLPVKPRRRAAEQDVARCLTGLARTGRERFLRAHVAAVYDELTQGRSRPVRADDLCYEAARLFPGLVPTRAEVAAESEFQQSDKDGIEIEQGIFLSHVLAHEAAGRHLVQAMLFPRPDSVALIADFGRTGSADLNGARVERRGKAAFVTLRNPRFLNAEDSTTLDGIEIAVDLALLDPACEICVIRGGRIEHPKYAGRRIFGAGINLTHIYQGKIPFLWFMTRDLGFVNKVYRGLASERADELAGESLEKLWIAAVESFAIGGHCQILLAVDYILAESDAYLSLPARKEGIIPGAANLRLPRFVGDRLARQAILYERRFDCDSPEGRLLCDRVVATGEMDSAVEETVAGLTSSGVVSAAGNRRALRVAEEPLDTFRRYMAVYAREQAQCHFSPALIANLERNWDAKSRKG